MAGPYEFFTTYLLSGSGGNYTVVAPGLYVMVNDYQGVADDSSDNLNVLGDIGSDHFQTASYGNGIGDGTGVPFTSAPPVDPSIVKFTGQFVGTVTQGVSFVGSYNHNHYLYVHFGSGSPGSTATVTGSSFNLVCFATGTRIRTMRGEVAVEDLREGEDVITASGEARAITWIGHRRTDCAHHPRPKDVWPVLVESGALGNKTPERDLYLTPFHAVALTCGSEVLVPVHCLINGTTIRQVPVDEITYWHVELETHDILVANGAAAESYLDTGNRSGFENAEGHVDLHPDFKPADDADFCRPLVTSGPILTAIRASLPVDKSLAA